MNTRTAIYIVYALLVAVILSSVYYDLGTHRDTWDMLIPARLIVSRFSVTSHPETLIDIDQIDFDRYPRLKSAFEVEERSNAMGLVHPIEWVNCTNREGRKIVELFTGWYNPLRTDYFINIRYRDQNYSIVILFRKTPPIL